MEQINEQARASRQGYSGVVALVASRHGEELTLADLAQAAGMPSNTLTRQFNRRFRMSPMRWLWCFRSLLAAEVIAASPEWSLVDVATACGFKSPAHFSRRFSEHLGVSPSRYRTVKRRSDAAARATSPDDLLKRAFAALSLRTASTGR